MRVPAADLCAPNSGEKRLGSRIAGDRRIAFAPVFAQVTMASMHALSLASLSRQEAARLTSSRPDRRFADAHPGLQNVARSCRNGREVRSSAIRRRGEGGTVDRAVNLSERLALLIRRAWVDAGRALLTNVARCVSAGPLEAAMAKSSGISVIAVVAFVAGTRALSSTITYRRRSRARVRT